MHACILRTRKSDVKEKRLREVLRDLGLPENQVVTIRHVGWTDYELEPDESKRKELIRQAETAKKERKLTFKLRKIVRKIQPNATIYVNLTDEDDVVRLRINCRPAKDVRMNELFVKNGEKRDLGQHN